MRENNFRFAFDFFAEGKKGKGKKGKKSADQKAKGGKGGKDGGKVAAKPEKEKKAEEAPAKPQEKQEEKPKSKEELVGIPVKKEVLIGVTSSNLSLDVWGLWDVKQMEGLFRVHTLQAQLSGRSSPQYTDLVLQAVAYVMQIWQVGSNHCTVISVRSWTIVALPCRSP